MKMENLIFITLILCGTVLEDGLANLVRNNNFSDNFFLNKLDFSKKVLMLKKLLLSMNGNIEVEKKTKELTTFSITIPTASNSSSFENKITNTSIRKAQNIPNRKGAFILKVRNIIETKINDESFGIQQLCKEIGLSRSQLHNKIKAETGLSTSIYIRSVKLGKAKFLLDQTELNVSEIAYMVGYKDPSYFSRLFVERYNLSPSKYRNRLLVLRKTNLHSNFLIQEI